MSENTDKSIAVLPFANLSADGQNEFICDGHLISFNFLKEIAQDKPGEKVLINGASGALGTSAIQIAKCPGDGGM